MTLLELINEEIDLDVIGNYSSSTAKSMLKQQIYNLLIKVRQVTLSEAADNADADYNYSGDYTPIGEIENDIEVYVLKQSILQLPTDKIKI